MYASRTQNGKKNSWENLKRVSGRENKSEPKRKITNNRVTDRGKHEKKKKKNMEDGGKHEETGRTVEDEAIGSGSGLHPPPAPSIVGEYLKLLVADCNYLNRVYKHLLAFAASTFKVQPDTLNISHCGWTYPSLLNTDCSTSHRVKVNAAHGTIDLDRVPASNNSAQEKDVVSNSLVDSLQGQTSNVHSAWELDVTQKLKEVTSEETERVLVPDK
ncbi:hypothetical protein RUM43_003930 [Polyplax serrata]|uniref:Uncharacterized protein n=1 Tax=Polyplax serrata TaxID=468196 RepID=A0AAN8P738_POLSC